MFTGVDMSEVTVKLLGKFNDWRFVVHTARVSGVPEKVKCPECRGVALEKPCHRCNGEGEASVTDEMIIEMILKNDYTSCLEHIVFSFDVTMSKLLAPEFLEHRIASHTAKSTRYTSNLDNGYVVPSYFAQHGLESSFVEFQKRVEDFYVFLRDEMDVPRDQARNVLTMSTKTRYIWTINARSLINFLGLRLCPRSYSGMQELARQVLKIVRAEEPEIFKHIDCRGYNMGVCPENQARPKKCRHPEIPTKEEVMQSYKKKKVVVEV
jgi:thymidylate synthase (FAD)